MALGIPEAIAEVTKLLSKVFGFAVDPDGYAQLKRENQLKLIMRGIDNAITQNDWAACDALFQSYERMRREA